MEWLEQWDVVTEPTREDKLYTALEGSIWIFNAGFVIWSVMAI